MSSPIPQIWPSRDQRLTQRWLFVAIACLIGTLIFSASALASDRNQTGEGTSKHITLTVIDAANGNPLANAVIAVIGSGVAQPHKQPAEMAQENHKFMPHVLIVPQHQAVDFPNRDTTRHHVYSFSKPKQFNIDLYAGHPKAPIDFDTPGIVELGCNIHDKMQAFPIALY